MIYTTDGVTKDSGGANNIYEPGLSLCRNW